MLLLVSILVAGFHMIAPDHWIPLISISSSRNYSHKKTYGIATALGSIHAISSSAIAVFFVFLGLVFFASFVTEIYYVSEILLVIVGVYFLVNGIKEEGGETALAGNSILAISVFPDLALAPILLSGITLPLSDLSIIIAAFILTSVISLFTIVFFSSGKIGSRLSRLKPNHMDYAIAAMLFATAAFLYAFPQI